MSADGLKTCPRCAAEHKRAIQAADAAVADLIYRQGSAEEILRATDDRTKLKARKPEATFREDYEFYGAEDGTIVADYGGECQACGLTARLKHSVTFYPEPKP